MRKNKKIIGSLAVVLAVMTALSGATFAWFTSQDSVTNHVETDQLTSGDVKLVEIFDPDDPFNPGVDINKDVWAVNTGSTDAIVRISFAEVLTKLALDGKAVNFTKVYDGTKYTAPVDPADDLDDSAQYTAIPLLFNSDSIAAGGAYDSAAGWKELTTVTSLAVDGITSIVGLPANVTLRYFYKTLTSAGRSYTNYTFVAYAPITSSDKYNGKLQNISADFDVDENGALTVSNVKYPVFVVNKPVQKKWALLTNHATDADSPIGVGFGLATPIPTVANPLPDTITETRRRWQSATDPLLELVFANIGATTNSVVITALDTVTPANDAGKWWYNADDGYFYYIGKVAPGQATPVLLDAVGLNFIAGDAHNNLSFDLIVKMDAVQNVKEALSTSTAGGWGLAGVILANLTNSLNAAAALV
jgi:alternate signal-mediated exported protein